jgi:GTPase SAR1 family protein
MSNYCKNCRTETELFFCQQCGEIFEYPSYIEKDSELKKRFHQIVSSIVNNYNKTAKEVENTSAKSVLAKSVEQYYKKIALLQKQCESSDVAAKLYQALDGGFLFKEMQIFGDKCLSNECSIALVGTIKAGKSCLINALLGRELASVDIVPETASLTKFRHKPKDVLKVTFYSREEWSELWNSVEKSSNPERFKSVYKELNAESFKDQWVGHAPLEISISSESDLKEKIAEYSSAKKPIHYFVKELEVGLSDFNIPPQVVFVDTPGLDDPIAYRSDTTREYLKKSNIVLLCIKTQSLNQNEILTIEKLFSDMRYAKKRVYILGTQYDIHGDALNTWERFKKDWIQYLSEDNFYGDDASERIFPIAPYMYTMIKNYDPHKFESFKQKDKDDFKNGINNLLDKETELSESEWDDLENKFGRNKVRNNKELFIFDKNKNKLIELTKVESFKKKLIDGPVKKSEEIITEDIHGNYIDLKEKIIKLSSAIRDFQENAISISHDKDWSTKIHELSEQIKQSKNRIQEFKTLYKKITENIQHASEAISSIKLN